MITPKSYLKNCLKFTTMHNLLLKNIRKTTGKPRKLLLLNTQSAVGHNAKTLFDCLLTSTIVCTRWTE